jgi:hypothetical protein
MSSGNLPQKQKASQSEHFFCIIFLKIRQILVKNYKIKSYLVTQVRYTMVHYEVVHLLTN